MLPLALAAALGTAKRKRSTRGENRLAVVAAVAAEARAAKEGEAAKAAEAGAAKEGTEKQTGRVTGAASSRVV